MIFFTKCRILDNLPVAVLRQRRDGSQSTTYEHGFRVGFKGNYAGVSLIGKTKTLISYSLVRSRMPRILISHLFFQSKEEKYFINNHLSFRVMYHKDLETDYARIVGFEVTPNRYLLLIPALSMATLKFLLQCLSSWSLIGEAYVIHRNIILRCLT